MPNFNTHRFDSDHWQEVRRNRTEYQDHPKSHLKYYPPIKRWLEDYGYIPDHPLTNKFIYQIQEDGSKEKFIIEKVCLQFYGHRDGSGYAYYLLLRNDQDSHVFITWENCNSDCLMTLNHIEESRKEYTFEE